MDTQVSCLFIPQLYLSGNAVNGQSLAKARYLVQSFATHGNASLIWQIFAIEAWE